MTVLVLSHFSRVWLFVTPWTVTSQAPLSMGFFRQKYWSGESFLSPGDLPNPGVEPWSPVLQADALPFQPGNIQNRSSVQFSHSVMSHSLRPHELQHTRPPCPSPTPGACSSSCPSNQWCHPTISSSVIPFSFCLQSFPGLGSFLMSQFFTSDGQSIGASTSVLPMNIQDWFPLGLSGLILQSKGLPRVFSNTTVQKYQFFRAQLSSWSNSIHTWLSENNSFD